MSDMDAFGDDIPQEQNQNENEVDPAAEFLAREQSELAGLQDDNFEVVSNEQNGGKYLALQSLCSNFESVSPCAIQVTDIAAEESPNPSPPQEPIITNGPAEEFTPQVTQIKNVKEEPEKLKLWREKQQEMLEQKDEEEEKKKNELRDGAKKELDEWYSRYNDQIEKSKVNNRNAEKEYVTARDATQPGQEWERIATLCDFNPKSSRATKDVSRMRSILLQLKQTPPAKA
ncbi:Clathrin light chain A [Nymphon striatum]|nr:Clathrin light chain A [Nymphon striatum]